MKSRRDRGLAGADRAAKCVPGGPAVGIAAPVATRSWRRLAVPAVVAVVASLAGLGAGRYFFGQDSGAATTLNSTLLLPPDVR